MGYVGWGVVSINNGGEKMSAWFAVVSPKRGNVSRTSCIVSISCEGGNITSVLSTSIPLLETATSKIPCSRPSIAKDPPLAAGPVQWP